MMKVKAAIFCSMALLSSQLAQAAPYKGEAPWVGEFVADRVVTASSPDNNYEALRQFYGSAMRTIHISVYQIDNVNIGDILEDALERGVSVRILVEGSPIPKLPVAELYIAKRLSAKGAKFYFYDNANGRNNRRFKYLHAKYGIVDGRRVIVGSANYGNNGHPLNTTAGNREWEIIVDDVRAARLFEQTFAHDIGLEGEAVLYGSSDRYTFNDPKYKPDRSSKEGDYKLKLEPVEDHDVLVQTVFAPDNSLDKNGALLGTLKKAKESVIVQQLSFETYWGDKPYNPDPEESPMMNILIKLARAGRAIRILLNDDFIFRDPDRFNLLAAWTEAAVEPESFEMDGLVAEKPPRDNRATVDYLRKIAKKEGLDLTAKLLKYKKCGVGVLHNKGFVVDGRATLVGSLNWGESALKFNREAGVVVSSPVVAGYYTKAFNHDWKCSR